MRRTGADQLVHDRMVLTAINWLKKRGYQNFSADLDSYLDKPLLLKGEVDGKTVQHRPDIACQDPSGNWLIAEVETCSSLTTEHTRSQWMLFRKIARMEGWGFMIGFPKHCRDVRGKQEITTDDVVRGFLKAYGIDCEMRLQIS